jgi:D-alanyl-D-alanine carboxypeptidase
MKAVTDSIIENTNVPGIVALVVDHKRGIDWLYTSGLSDIPNNLPMKGDYTFRIASITKTMAVTVLLQLVDEGYDMRDKT